MPLLVRVRRIVLLAALICFGSTSFAHEVRPAYLQLTQEDETTFHLLFKVPASGELRLDLAPVLPETCDTIGPADIGIVNGAFIERATIACESDLGGETIAIDGLSRMLTDVLVRIERIDGNVQVVRLTPSKPAFVIASSPNALDIAQAYALLGVEHILGGIDHLLFVLALLLIVRGWRRLVVTITAFTVAHSITLAAATLGLIRVSQQAVEAVIALSIVFIASEIIHMHRGRPGTIQRRPWVVALVFGLLHGLGFASALSDIGLPQQATALALLLFNFGVEAGQLLFIAGVMLSLWIVRKTAVAWPRGFEQLPAYGIGVIAAFWTIERVVGMFV